MSQQSTTTNPVANRVAAVVLGERIKQSRQAAADRLRGLLRRVDECDRSASLDAVSMMSHP